MTLLIYDCDGVLVDSEVLASEALAELMTMLGHPMTTAECARVFGGRSVNDVLTRANEILGRPIPDDLGKKAAQQLMARFRQELKPVHRCRCGRCFPSLSAVRVVILGARAFEALA